VTKVNPETENTDHQSAVPTSLNPGDAHDTLVLDVASQYAAALGLFTHGTTWLLGTGLMAAVLAAVPGFVDAMPIASNTPPIGPR